jgi:diadenosine tetraphosphate (Ap4A) HIT family hydrolase
MTPDFVLHERLVADTAVVGDLVLTRVLLMNDSRFPWLILVPRRANIVELFELSDADQAALGAEISRASRMLKAMVAADKINLGALGNLVPQLHVHVVARKRNDLAWPGPVWGHGNPKPYTAAARETRLLELATALKTAPV